ncbi:MAG: poly(3-hydroxybutyrate) depolymerase [Azoarcus sp.]|nr:poly(3-hydroxybutyrate) depolymerase [Azoarcus sp.]
MPPKLALTRFSALLLALVATAADAAPLPALGADLSGVTVSGVSSGAYMATQFQIAHSTLVGGAGILAGGPYDCAEASLLRALRNCTTPGSSTPPPTPTRTLERIRSHATAGRIDPVAGLRDDRVWVFSGGADHTVDRAVVDSLLGFYRQQIPEDALRFVTLPTAGHAMISVASPKPNACETSEAPFINRCGDFDAPGELLAHLLGPLQPRGTASARHLRRFDQAPYTPLAPVDLSLADEALLYVPAACESGGCKVHVAFHGCRQGEEQIGLGFVGGAGYNEWAETNRLLVLYPQVRQRSGFAWGSWRWVYNPKGCWDWWGYTGNTYPTREGAQIRAVRAMLEKLAEPPATGTTD